MIQSLSTLTALNGRPTSQARSKPTGSQEATEDLFPHSIAFSWRESRMCHVPHISTRCWILYWIGERERERRVEKGRIGNTLSHKFLPLLQILILEKSTYFLGLQLLSPLKYRIHLKWRLHPVHRYTLVLLCLKTI